MPLATDDDGVDDCTALARIGMADEEPMLLGDGGWADGVLDQVIVDLLIASLAIDFGFVPDAQGIITGFACQALGQVRLAHFDQLLL